MATRLGSKLAHAWNAFTNQDEEIRQNPRDLGASYGVRPDRIRTFISNERSIIASIYARMAIDIASVELRHSRLDDQERYIGEIDSALNNCLKLEANLDQEARAFRQDIAESMFNNGSAVLVPIDTTANPLVSGSFDIQTMRVAEVLQWYPKYVRVSVYNENTGRREELTLPKRNVGIVPNPLYAVMNEPNSTLQRVIRKLNILDSIDEQSASGKLDLIIQLPYVVKSETMKKRAAERQKDIEFQLRGSKYGIAYTDGTEKITQLNRPAENNLMGQIEYLMKMLYGELGLTPEIMLGTADEASMLNYNNRTIEPIVAAIANEMKRKFLTKTARSQGQSVEYFRDPFKLVPMKDLAEMADKFTRNEIVSSNEFRQFIGLKPSNDPKADQLINSNMPPPAPAAAPATDATAVTPDVSAPIVTEDPEVVAAAKEQELNRQMAELGLA